MVATKTKVESFPAQVADVDYANNAIHNGEKWIKYTDQQLADFLGCEWDNVHDTWIQYQEVECGYLGEVDFDYQPFDVELNDLAHDMTMNQWSEFLTQIQD